jgi:Ca-activated chloride channel family protein
MRAALPAALALTAALAADAAGVQFRSSVRTVAVYATVTDREGRLVPDLTRDAFTVFDNGTPVEITTFSSEIQPITVAVLLDMSGSMTSRFMRVREATVHFIDALLPHDRATIGTFGYEIAVSPLLTGDKDILKRVVHEEVWPGGGTPLWNAMDAGMSALAGETGRRVILVLTDGADTGSLPGHKAGAGAVTRRARDEGFMVYAIGMEGVGLRGMSDLADETGGGRFELEGEADLSATFARVAEELRRQYMIGFTPASLDGREHRLEVRVAGDGLRARARRSYVAAPEKR